MQRDLGCLCPVTRAVCHRFYSEQERHVTPRATGQFLVAKVSVLDEGAVSGGSGTEGSWGTGAASWREDLGQTPAARATDCLLQS